MSLKTILIKRGNKIDLPTLLPGELGFCEDTKELFIGSMMGNRNITGSYTKEEMLSIIEDATLHTVTNLTGHVEDVSFNDAEYIRITLNGVEKAMLNAEIFNATPQNASIEYLLDTFEIEATTIPVVIDATQKVSPDTVAKFLDLRKNYFYTGDVTMSIVIDGVEHVVEEIEISTASTPEDSYVWMYLPDSDTGFGFSYTGVLDEAGIIPDANSTLTFNISAYSGEILLNLYRQAESWSVSAQNLNNTDVIAIAAVHKTGLLSTVYDKTEVYNKAETVKLIATEILYADLVQLTYRSGLKIGAQYRITDYETVVSSTIENVRSANKPFDIIVTAISDSKISTSAIAVQSDRPGALYFTETWQIEYTLTNYPWVGSGGKGTILRLTDKHNNSLPYDFKNIQFYVEPSRLTGIDLSAHIASDNYYYTFSRLSNNLSVDASTLTAVHNNYIATISYLTSLHSPAHYASIFVYVSNEEIAYNRFTYLRNSIVGRCIRNTVALMTSCSLRTLVYNDIDSITSVIATEQFHNNYIRTMRDCQVVTFTDNVVEFLTNTSFDAARKNNIAYMSGCKVGKGFTDNVLHCQLTNVVFGNSAEDLFDDFIGNTWIGAKQYNTIVNNPVLYGYNNQTLGKLIRQANSLSIARFTYYDSEGTLVEGNVTI